MNRFPGRVLGRTIIARWFLESPCSYEKLRSDVRVTRSAVFALFSLTQQNTLLVFYSFRHDPSHTSRRNNDVGTCPECECEFEDPIEVCPHCSVPLVTREEQVDQNEEDDDVDGDLPAEGLVVIEATGDDSRVGELRELLEESGIPCFLSNELFPTEPPPDETKVLIPREMAGDARKLIREYSC